jgi:hypothetical protein
VSAYTWRLPSPAELDLAESWVAEWNAVTGDRAALGSSTLVRTSCGCGSCPSFAVKPLELSTEHAKSKPLRVEGSAMHSASQPGAGLIAFALEGGVDFEIYPLGDESASLETLTFVFHDEA